MKPIEFDISNAVLAENQKEYNKLPCFVDINSPQRTVVSRWRFSLKERLMILVFGDIWLSQSTFGKSYQPTKLDSSKWGAFIKGEIKKHIKDLRKK